MTKIDIISGFLGAGKTTFIKKMLTEAFAGEQVVLIENEFGEIGIDSGFLKESGIEDPGDEFRMYLLFSCRRFREIVKRGRGKVPSGPDTDRAVRRRKAVGCDQSRAGRAG